MSDDDDQPAPPEPPAPAPPTEVSDDVAYEPLPLNTLIESDWND